MVIQKHLVNCMTDECPKWQIVTVTFCNLLSWAKVNFIFKYRHIDNRIVNSLNAHENVLILLDFSLEDALSNLSVQISKRLRKFIALEIWDIQYWSSIRNIRFRSYLIISKKNSFKENGNNIKL